MQTKSVLITGGSRGIGAATALLAAEKGWDVVITFRSNQDAANKVVTQIENLGRRAMAIKVDVSNEADIVSMYNVIDSEFGAINALVNNAGIIAPISSFLEIDAKRIEKVFAVNVIGSFICAREAVKRMSIDEGGIGGNIVNVSSAAARIGSPNEFIDYAASKGAIDTFTLGLSKEVAKQGIRVNVVRPGLINTEMHADAGDETRPERLQQFVPMQRPGDAKEIATSIVWLMSEEASYVNGALLDVAGGR